ncbi:MAG: hypothetical protein ACN4EP_03625 [Sediminibacterium sp.]
MKIAWRYLIIDKVNNRSSHTNQTIRGAGIIFPIAILLGTFCEIKSFNILLQSVSLLIIATVSFIDDIKNLDSKIRLVIQGIAAILIVFSISADFNLLMGSLFIILIVGVVNAYNFLDGVNGMTALYSIITLISIYISNLIIGNQPNYMLFVSLFTALLVFAFYNFRNVAVCFAGDVGPVSLAINFFLQIFNLWIATGYIWWAYFLIVYGIDSICTILFRIIRKEPILKPHRSHFYQYLANETSMTHLKVSFLYSFCQLLFNALIIYSYYYKLDNMFLIIVLICYIVGYVLLRLGMEGKNRLLRSYVIN